MSPYDLPLLGGFCLMIYLLSPFFLLMICLLVLVLPFGVSFVNFSSVLFF